jgi:hypothetical protein
MPMLLLATMALGAAVPADEDWREFERRDRGWSETPTYYDAAHVKRRGDIVRVEYRYVSPTSGVPDYLIYTRVEFACASRHVRILRVLYYGGIYMLSRREPYRAEHRIRYAPIAAGSEDDVLARLLCPGAQAAPAPAP